MSIFTMLFIYILIWWTALFAVLPIGVRGQAEEEDVVEGSEPGAPVESGMKKKIILTSLLAGVIWAVVMLVIKFELVDPRIFDWNVSQ